VRRNNIFKPTTVYKRLHQDSNDNGVRIVNFATSKNLVIKSMMFLHRNIHKYTWTSPNGKIQKQIEHIFLQTGDGIRVHSMYDLFGELTAILTTNWWLQKLGKD